MDSRLITHCDHGFARPNDPGLLPECPKCRKGIEDHYRAEGGRPELALARSVPPDTVPLMLTPPTCLHGEPLPWDGSVPNCEPCRDFDRERAANANPLVPVGQPVLGAPRPKRSLMELLQRLNDLGDELADADFDPEVEVGDIRDKVDGIKAILDRLEVVEAHLRKIAKPIAAKAASMKRNYDRLWDYVAASMAVNKLQMIPGHTFKVSLRDSQPAMTMDRPATPDDFAKWPGYVTLERSYRWDTERIKAEALAGTLKIRANVEAVSEDEDAIPATITVGHWPDFRVNVPEQLEKPKPKKKEKKVEPKA